MDDEKKKRILAQPGVLEAIREMADATKPFTEFQNSITLPVIEFQRAISEPAREIRRLFDRINSPVFELTRTLSGIISDWVENVQPVIDEIENQNKLAKEEADKIPAKLKTVSDYGHTIEIVKKEIFRLEEIEKSCLDIIGQLNRGLEFYADLDRGVDCSEDIEGFEMNLKTVNDYLARCQKLLKDKRVQHEFLTLTDAAYKPKPDAADLFGYDVEYVNKIYDICQHNVFLNIAHNEFCQCVAAADFAPIFERVVANKTKSRLLYIIHKLHSKVNEKRWYAQSAASIGHKTKDCTKYKDDISDRWISEIDRIK